MSNSSLLSFSWSRMTAPAELATRYTTPDTTVDIGSTGVKTDHWEVGYSNFSL